MPHELIGDSARREAYALARLVVEGDRIVEADAPGMSRPLAGLTAVLLLNGCASTEPSPEGMRTAIPSAAADATAQASASPPPTMTSNVQWRRAGSAPTSTSG